MQKKAISVVQVLQKIDESKTDAFIIQKEVLNSLPKKFKAGPYRFYRVFGFNIKVHREVRSVVFSWQNIQAQKKRHPYKIGIR